MLHVSFVYRIQPFHFHGKKDASREYTPCITLLFSTRPPPNGVDPLFLTFPHLSPCCHPPTIMFTNVPMSFTTARDVQMARGLTRNPLFWPGPNPAWHGSLCAHASSSRYLISGIDRHPRWASGPTQS